MNDPRSIGPPIRGHAATSFATGPARLAATASGYTNSVIGAIISTGACRETSCTAG